MLLLLVWFFSTLKCTKEESKPIEDIPTDTLDIFVPEPIDTIVIIEPVDIIPSVLPHIAIARLSIGKPPVDSIRVWMNFVGFTERDPFCAGAQSWWLYQAGVKSPNIRTALARNFVYKSDPRDIILAPDVLRGAVTVPAGYLVVYQSENTIFGHVGTLIEAMSGRSGIYISANTTAPGRPGSIASGGEVHEKPFDIVPGARLAVREFVRVKY